jgi:hypothetical protein
MNGLRDIRFNLPWGWPNEADFCDPDHPTVGGPGGDRETILLRGTSDPALLSDERFVLLSRAAI